LQSLNPALLIINGTRIIAEDILNCIPSKFINMHAGITPLYRGAHGAYWALVEGNKKACGVTVHLVDAGIDTGSILEQGLIEPKKEDNLVTYPLPQLAAGLPLLKKTIKNILNGQVETQSPPKGQSRLCSHPTLLEYLKYRVRFGVK
jgi:methionyl-tRNA formyltransferase